MKDTDKIRPEHFYSQELEKTKLNWFCYEYALELQMYIDGEIKTKLRRKKVNDLKIADFCIHYAKIIKGSSVTHERLLEAVEFGKTHNLINYSILEFLASKKWEEIEHIRNSGDVNGYNNSELL